MRVTRELKGTKKEIIDQIAKTQDPIVSVTLVIDEPVTAPEPLTDEEFARLMAELEAMAVSAPHADLSREAMYTRMPGE